MILMCWSKKKNEKNIFIVYFQLKSTFIKIFYIALPNMKWEMRGYFRHHSLEYWILKWLLFQDN